MPWRVPPHRSMHLGVRADPYHIWLSEGDVATNPGIGDYTASAIASIAFDQPVAVLDGMLNASCLAINALKLFSLMPKRKPKYCLGIFWIEKRPGEFAQATMDLGATICTPKRPACSLCPINTDCQGFKNGDAENFPYKKPKAHKPTRKGAAFVITNSNGEVFLPIGRIPALPKHTFTPLSFGAYGMENLTTIDAVPSGMAWWCKKGILNEEALPKVMHKVLQKAL
ncbi:Adenine DNA glycosylase [Nymphon striatum]|nr:Adenine DNA glycosylase [Nymphon striatum]